MAIRDFGVEDADRIKIMRSFAEVLNREFFEVIAPYHAKTEAAFREARAGKTTLIKPFEPL